MGLLSETDPEKVSILLDENSSDSDSDEDMTSLAKTTTTTSSYDPATDKKLKRNPKVSLEKFSEKKFVVSTPEIVESDSEYETEKVYEYREWYPPDFWRAKVQDNKNRIFMTDVTADDVTITMIESCNGDGFFKEL